MGATKEMYIQIQDAMFAIESNYEQGNITALDAALEMRAHKTELETLIAISSDFEQRYQQEIANEAAQYPEGYKGYEIKLVNGRKMFSFKGISEHEQAQSELKKIEEAHKLAWESYQKGNQPTIEENGKLYWVDGDGFAHEFTEVNFGKSYLTFKEKK